MATGLLRLRGVGGRAGWRYLFLIEGILTLVVGIASYFMMPPGPTQTKAWFRPKGWFSERYVVRYDSPAYPDLPGFPARRSLSSTAF